MRSSGNVALGVCAAPQSASPRGRLCRALDRTDLALALFFATLAAVIILPGLGRQSLASWDEAIYGAIARDLLKNFGPTLHYGGAPWFEKPPLVFWLMAGSSWIFGANEFGLRLPSAICGIGAVTLQYVIGARLAGRVAGALAAILLIGVPQFIAYSRLAMLDVPLLTIGMSAIFLLTYSAERPGLMIPAGAVLGVAALAKSAAALLFVPGFLAMTAAIRGLPALWSKETLLAGVGAVLVALAWPAWSALTYGSAFLDQFLFFHIVERFLRPLEGHTGNALYYFQLYWHNAGWIAVVHGAGILLGAVLALRRRDPLLGAVVFFAVSAFIGVNAQQTKIGWYLTPVYSAAALAAAFAAASILRTTYQRFLTIILAGLIAFPAVAVGRDIFVEQYNILDYSPEIRSLRTMHPALREGLAVLYTVGVSAPAPQFYLAQRVEAIDEAELERLIAGRQGFYCLLFGTRALDVLRTHPDAGIELVASSESLAIIRRN